MENTMEKLLTEDYVMGVAHIMNTDYVKVVIHCLVLLKSGNILRKFHVV